MTVTVTGWDVAPEVREDATYSVTVTELSYGQGQIHSDWGGPVTGTIDLMLDVYEPTDAAGVPRWW